MLCELLQHRMFTNMHSIQMKQTMEWITFDFSTDNWRILVFFDDGCWLGWCFGKLLKSYLDFKWRKVEKSCSEIRTFIDENNMISVSGWRLWPWPNPRKCVPVLQYFNSTSPASVDQTWLHWRILLPTIPFTAMFWTDRALVSKQQNSTSENQWKLVKRIKGSVKIIEWTCCHGNNTVCKYCVPCISVRQVSPTVCCLFSDQSGNSLANMATKDGSVFLFWS